MTLPDSSIIEPMEYLVLVQDTSVSSFDYVQTLEWSSGTINGNSDTVIIKDGEGITIDSIVFSNTSPWPSISGSNLIELISFLARLLIDIC